MFNVVNGIRQEFQRPIDVEGVITYLTTAVSPVQEEVIKYQNLIKTLSEDYNKFYPDFYLKDKSFSPPTEDIAQKFKKFTSCNDYANFDAKKRKAKNNLEAIYPSVSFDLALGEKFTSGTTFTSTNIISLDVDKMTPDELKSTFDILKVNPYVLMLFVSPSRTGLKILVRHTPLTDSANLPLLTSLVSSHPNAYQLADAYHHIIFNDIPTIFPSGLTFDPSCKNLNRLCFLPNGLTTEEVYYNLSALTFAVDVSKYLQTLTEDNVHQKTTNAIKAGKVVNEKTGTKSTNYSDLIKTFKTKFLEKHTSLECWWRKGAGIKFNIADYDHWFQLCQVVIHGLKDKTDYDILQTLFCELSEPATNYDKAAAEAKFKHVYNAKTFYPGQVFLFKKLLKVLSVETKDFPMFNLGKEDTLIILSELGYNLTRNTNSQELFYSYQGAPKAKITDSWINSRRVEISTFVHKDLFGRSREMMEFLNVDEIPQVKPILEWIGARLTGYTYQESISEFETFSVWLAKTCHTSKDDIFKMFRYFFINTFIGALTPGGKNRILLVLKCAKQGIGKGEIIKSFGKSLMDFGLFGEGFDFANFNGYESKFKMAENLLIFVPEVSNLEVHAATFKSIMQMSYLDLVMKYQNHGTRMKRTASFMGDTNNDYMFNDNTGGARYFVVDIKEQSIKSSEIHSFNYDKIWNFFYQEYLKIVSNLDGYWDEIELFISHTSQLAERYNAANMTDFAVWLQTYFIKDETYIVQANQIQALAYKSHHKNSNVKLAQTLKNMGVEKLHRKEGNYYRGYMLDEEGNRVGKKIIADPEIHPDGWFNEVTDAEANILIEQNKAGQGLFKK